jgi:hypothetical protein
MLFDLSPLHFDTGAGHWPHPPHSGQHDGQLQVGQFPKLTVLKQIPHCDNGDAKTVIGYPFVLVCQTRWFYETDNLC